MFGQIRSFLRDARGVSALMFGIATPAIMLAVGGGIDYSQAAARRQRIASAVELACQHSGLEVGYQRRQSSLNLLRDYAPTVTQIATTKINDAAIDGITAVTVTSTIVLDVITINAASTSTNAFGGIVGRPTIAVSVSRNCNVTYPPTNSGELLFSESFENNHNVASNSWTVLNNWNGWTTQSGKGGIEINGMPELAANTIRFGNFFAELDSHCYTSNCRTNSNMWREFANLEVGNYELSYWYISRVRNPAYAGQTLCAYKTDAKAVWDKLVAANWEGYTNRIEVFFQQKKLGVYSTLPIDSNTDANLVDVCVHTDMWTERKIPLKVTTKGTYRIFFQAAGREDTYGGLIDYIRFCSGSCP